MIAEAVDAALLLWRALWLWLLAGAVVVTAGGLGVVAGVWWAVTALRRVWRRARARRRGDYDTAA